MKLLNLPVGIHYHQQYFAQAEPDDSWLPHVGTAGWIVVGQDYSYHLKPNEAAALKQYSVGCFYIWGSEAKRWDTLRLFARAYDRIVLAAQSTAKPFLYHVQKNGRMKEIAF